MYDLNIFRNQWLTPTVSYYMPLPLAPKLLHSACLSTLWIQDIIIIYFLQILAAPIEFLTEIQSVQAVEDEPAVFTCEISDENAEVTWMKNDEEIKPNDEKYEFIVSGKKRGLKVKSTDVSDTAEFTCKTKDKTSSASLTVTGTSYYLIYLYNMFEFSSLTSLKLSHLHKFCTHLRSHLQIACVIQIHTLCLMRYSPISLYILFFLWWSRQIHVVF